MFVCGVVLLCGVCIENNKQPLYMLPRPCVKSERMKLNTESNLKSFGSKSSSRRTMSERISHFVRPQTPIDVPVNRSYVRSFVRFVVQRSCFRSLFVAARVTVHTGGHNTPYPVDMQIWNHIYVLLLFIFSSQSSESDIYSESCLMQQAGRGPTSSSVHFRSPVPD